MLYIVFSQFKKYIGPNVRFRELNENTIKSRRVSCKTACVRNKRNICICNSVRGVQIASSLALKCGRLFMII